MGDLQFLNRHPRGNELSKSSSKSGAMARRYVWLIALYIYIYISCIESMYYIYICIHSITVQIS